MKKLIVGVTGASGSVYAYRLTEVLLELGNTVHFVATDNGKKVMAYEMEIPFPTIIDNFAEKSKQFHYHDNDNLFEVIASGSYGVDGMVVAPCSMGTLGKASQGIGDTLLTRSIDVMLKEQQTLILGVRETPLNPIHLENMLKMSRMGVFILPPVPAFYHHPKSLDDIIDIYVGRVLKTLKIENTLHRIWKDTE